MCMQSDESVKKTETGDVDVDKDSLVLKTIEDVMMKRGRYRGWQPEDQKLLVHALMKM